MAYQMHTEQAQDFGLGVLALMALQGAANAEGTRAANSANQQLSYENRVWQEQMRASNYQAAVYDMQKAGLNPAMMYDRGGGGAVTPSPNTAPRMENVLASGVSGAAQAMQMMQGAAGIEQMGKQSELLAAQAAKTKSETIEHEVNTAQALANLHKTREEGKSVGLDVWLKDITKHAAQSSIMARAEQDVIKADVDKQSFAADVQKRKAAGELEQLRIPAGKAEADFWESMKSAPQVVQMLMRVLAPFMGGRR